MKLWFSWRKRKKEASDAGNAPQATSDSAPLGTRTSSMGEAGHYHGKHRRENFEVTQLIPVVKSDNPVSF